MNFNEYENKENKKLLTNKQQDAINSNIYPLYLKASAGTGKTTVIINKIIDILKNEKDISLLNFSIITFTNKASSEMQERLSNHLFYECFNNDKEGLKNEKFWLEQTDMCHMVDISTIHAFCEKIIREYGYCIKISHNFKVKGLKKEIADITNKVINSNYDNLLLNNINHYQISNLIMTLLNDNYNKGFVFDRKYAKTLMIGRKGNEYWNDLKKLFVEMYLEVYENVESLKLQKNILTPNDLIKYAAELLLNEKIAIKISEQYKYIFLDEFQDTDKNQFNLIHSLIKQGVKVFLVGDTQQSIYSFRGADVQSSQAMGKIIDVINKDKEFENEIILDENFRSDYLLIDGINRIFQKGFYFDGLKLEFPFIKLDTSNKIKNNFKPIRMCYEEEVSSIINYLVANEELNGQPIKYNDIVVLCRRNYDLDKLSAKLKAEGIPVEVNGGKGFYSSKEIVDTYKILNALIYPLDTYKTEICFTDYYTAFMQSNDESEFSLLIEGLKSVIHEETVENLLDLLYSRTHILEFYNQSKKYQEIANLSKLKNTAHELMSAEYIQPITFVEYLKTMIISGKEDEDCPISDENRQKGVISLYTIHKAKGLEFPIVLIPYFDNKLNRQIINPKIILDNEEGKIQRLAISDEILRFNNYGMDKDYIELIDNKVKQSLEEEIRILYVALTRAKNMLVLSCDKSYDEVKRSRFFDSYASWANWVAEVDNGDFEKEISFCFSN